MDRAKKVPATIDDYIAAFPEDVQSRLEAIRQTVRQAAPQAQETISYGMPTFRLKGFLVSFAAWKKHIGFYPISTAMEAAIPDLSNYKTSGKGTVQFPMDQPVPLPLIRKLVEFRVKETQGE
jgi:uncharacterized protein YdhG (YjbR/CyaY superfamily)